MLKTYEDLKQEYYPECAYFDRIAESGSGLAEAVQYYRNEVYQTLAELEAYFSIEGDKTNENIRNKKAA